MNRTKYLPLLISDDRQKIKYISADNEMNTREREFMHNKITRRISHNDVLDDVLHRVRG